ncbi:ribonuclease H-like domain-containing protein [Trichoderma novae-zelandiae]
MAFAASQAPVRPVAIPISFVMPAPDSQPESIQPEAIQSSEEYIQHLRDLVHSRSDLQKSGYVMHQLSQDDLNRKRRCGRCGRHLPSRMKRLMWLQKTPVQGKDEDKDGPGELIDNSQGDTFKKDKEAALNCRHHPGKVIRKKWSCCDGFPGSPPCRAFQEHKPKIYASGELEREWKFYNTPFHCADGSPAVAVVIDCEMGTATTGESELIRVSAVDYFSGKVLLDKLVYPDAKMLHYNTRYSGVTRQDMEAARRTRSCLFGRASARKALWEFIDPDTIVIGHGANSDLTCLRWIHPVIIDTHMVEKANRPAGEANQTAKGPETQVGNPQLQKEEVNGQQGSSENAPAVPRQKGGLSLKALAKERLGREIQIKGQGHDSVEDSIATRDVLHWNVCQMLERLAEC